MGKEEPPTEVVFVDLSNSCTKGRDKLTIPAYHWFVFLEVWYQPEYSTSIQIIITSIVQKDNMIDPTIQSHSMVNFPLTNATFLKELKENFKTMATISKIIFGSLLTCA